MDQAVSDQFEVRPPAADAGGFEVRPPKTQPSGLMQRVRDGFQQMTEPVATGSPESRVPLAAGGVSIPGAVATPVLNTAKRAARFVAGVPGGLVDMAKTAYNAVGDLSSSDDARQGKGEDELWSLYPGTQIAQRGQEFRDTAKTDVPLAVENVAGDALGMYVTDKATGAVTRPLKEIAAKTPAMLKQTARKVLVGGRATRNLVDETMKANEAETVTVAAKNAKNAQAQRKAVRKVEQANKDTMAEHASKVGRLREEDSATLEKHGKSVAEHKAEAARLQREQQEALAAAQEKNRQAAGKHKEAVVQTLEEREGSEQTAALRDQAQSDYERMTDEYFAAEDAEKAKAKGSENQRWTEARAKIGNEPESLQPVKDVIAKVEDGMDPEDVKEFKKVLRAQTEPEAIEQIRADLQHAAPWWPQGVAYEDLEPGLKAAVDQAVEAEAFIGRENLENAGEMSFNKIKGIATELNYRINSAETPGNIKGAMKQVAQTLGKLKDEIAAKRGATVEYNAANKATQDYQEAFGRERTARKEVGENRKRTLNRGAVVEDQEGKRLAALARHNPALVEQYRRVQQAGDHVDQFKDAETLRKSLPEAPNRPEEKAEPKPPRLKPAPESPVLHGRQRPPDLKPIPEPKPGEQPALRQVGPEEMRQARLGSLNQRIDWIRHRGEWIASGGGFYGLLRGILHGSSSEMGEAVVVASASLAATEGLASYLSRSEVQRWLVEPGVADWQQWERLPSEQRAAVAEGLRPAVREAQAKGIAVAPALLALVGLSQVSKNAGEAKRKVELHRYLHAPAL